MPAFEFPTEPVVQSAAPKHGRKAFGINVLVGWVLAVVVFLVGWAVDSPATAVVATLIALIALIGTVMLVVSGRSTAR
jgi:hypothetical protein